MFLFFLVLQENLPNQQGSRGGVALAAGSRCSSLPFGSLLESARAPVRGGRDLCRSVRHGCRHGQLVGSLMPTGQLCVGGHLAAVGHLVAVGAARCRRGSCVWMGSLPPAGSRAGSLPPLGYSPRRDGSTPVLSSLSLGTSPSGGSTPTGQLCSDGAAVRRRAACRQRGSGAGRLSPSGSWSPRDGSTPMLSSPPSDALPPSGRSTLMTCSLVQTCADRQFAARDQRPRLRVGLRTCSVAPVIPASVGHVRCRLPLEGLALPKSPIGGGLEGAEPPLSHPV